MRIDRDDESPLLKRIGPFQPNNLVSVFTTTPLHISLISCDIAPHWHFSATKTCCTTFSWPPYRLITATHLSHVKQALLSHSRSRSRCLHRTVIVNKISNLDWSQDVFLHDLHASRPASITGPSWSPTARHTVPCQYTSGNDDGVRERLKNESTLIRVTKELDRPISNESEAPQWQQPVVESNLQQS
jgi:hypothetical protein